eukprot:Pgem_evm1s4100
MLTTRLPVLLALCAVIFIVENWVRTGCRIEPTNPKFKATKGNKKGTTYANIRKTPK